MNKLKSYILQLIKNIELRNNPEALFSHRHSIVTELIPILHQIEREKLNKSFIEKLEFQNENSDIIIIPVPVFTTLKNIIWEFIEAAIFIIDYEIDTAYTSKKEKINIENPSQDYWYQRVDTTPQDGSIAFNNKGVYFENTIEKSEGKTYMNSEIYNSHQTKIEPKNVIINPFPVDNIKQEPKKFLYDLLLNLPYTTDNNIVFEGDIKFTGAYGGSRGWGFWNTSLSFFFMNVAWFVQSQDKNGNKFYVQTGRTGGAQDLFEIKSPNLKQDTYYTYKIKLSTDCVTYFINGEQVHQVNATSKNNCVPNSPMAFHNWVDNATYKIEKGAAKHVLQKTTGPRTTMMKNIVIYSSKK